LRKYEEAGNNFARLALLEELKTMPFGAVWDYYCLKKVVSVGEEWIKEVQNYENFILSKRS
jgi:L-rhamnose isomerase